MFVYLSVCLSVSLERICLCVIGLRLKVGCAASVCPKLHLGDRKELEQLLCNSRDSLMLLDFTAKSQNKLLISLLKIHWSIRLFLLSLVSP